MFGNNTIALIFSGSRNKNYWLNNFASCSMTNFGCSSGIQCPESGTVMPVTFAAKACVEVNAKFLIIKLLIYLLTHYYYYIDLDNSIPKVAQT
jgi:hypothetical protein